MPFRMSIHGPSSINPPTLELMPIGPKVKRPRLRFASPGQHWAYDSVEADEYDENEIIDMVPEATDLIDQLPEDWRAAALQAERDLEEPSDTAILRNARDWHENYIATVVAEAVYQAYGLTPTPGPEPDWTYQGYERVAP